MNGITDFVEAKSIVAADNSCYDHYLLKVTSSGAVSLEHDTIADYGAAYQKGTLVLEGSFFLRDNIIDMTYKLDKKKAIVHASTVRAICGELVLIRRQSKNSTNSRLLSKRKSCLFFSACSVILFVLQYFSNF